MEPTPALLPEKFHGWRSLLGYSPWGRKELDTTERIHFLSFYSFFWRRKWQPTPVFLPGESHGQRGLMGWRLWGCKESDTTKQLTHTHTHKHTPCLEINCSLVLYFMTTLTPAPFSWCYLGMPRSQVCYPSQGPHQFQHHAWLHLLTAHTHLIWGLTISFLFSGLRQTSQFKFAGPCSGSPSELPVQFQSASLQINSQIPACCPSNLPRHPGYHLHCKARLKITPSSRFSRKTGWESICGIRPSFEHRARVWLIPHIQVRWGRRSQEHRLLSPSAKPRKPGQEPSNLWSAVSAKLGLPAGGPTSLGWRTEGLRGRTSPYMVVVFLTSGLVPKIGVLLTEGKAASRKDEDLPE